MENSKTTKSSKSSWAWIKTPFILLLKSKVFIAMIKAVKAIKFIKPFATLISMALSVFVYSFMWGPWFAAGFVVMLFIHEMGHVIALKIKKLPASAPVFIPMLGAMIFSPTFRNRRDEAFVGFGGPLLGGISAFALFGAWMLMPEKSELVLMLSYIAAFVNLFNLIPISPMDGGRVTQVIGGWFKWIGFALLFILTIIIAQPHILLIWLIVIADLNLDPKYKLFTGIACQSLMMALMIFGFGEQPFWLNVLDTFLASFFNFGIWIEYKNLISRDDEERDAEVVPLSAQIKWLVYYLLLVGSLVVLMLWQIPHLPEALHR